MSTYEGGCTCGSIRYVCNEKTSFAFHCQCKQCQKITGSGHSSQFSVSADSVQLNGEIKYYELKSDSGHKVQSGFCPNCGNPILKRTSRFPDTLFIHASTLDDPSIFEPNTVVWTESAQPWDYINPELS